VAVAEPLDCPQFSLVDVAVALMEITLTVTEVDPEQLPDVPITTYVILVVGFAVTLAPVVSDKPEDGDQV